MWTRRLSARVETSKSYTNFVQWGSLTASVRQQSKRTLAMLTRRRFGLWTKSRGRQFAKAQAIVGAQRSLCDAGKRSSRPAPVRLFARKRLWTGLSWSLSARVLRRHMEGTCSFGARGQRVQCHRHKISQQPAKLTKSSGFAHCRCPEEWPRALAVAFRPMLSERQAKRAGSRFRIHKTQNRLRRGNGPAFPSPKPRRRRRRVSLPTVCAYATSAICTGALVVSTQWTESGIVSNAGTRVAWSRKES